MTDEETPDHGSENSVPPKHVGAVRNAAEPIRLTNVNFFGFAAEAAQPQQQTRIWSRLGLTSDDPTFHRIAENFANSINHLAKPTSINFGKANNVLLVIRPDQSGELWIDSAAISLAILAKNRLEAGTPVFDGDIGDVVALDFPCVDIGPDDKIFCIFREEWRFAMFFDLNRATALSRDDNARVLGALYRNIRYRNLYESLADKATFDRLAAAGWFAFVEILGNEFKLLAATCQAGFPLDDTEKKLMASFDVPRLDRMFTRWLMKPAFKSKEAILQSAINAYKSKDPVAVLKIILTEIEGILSDAHYAATGTRVKWQKLFEFARQSAERKSGAADSLLLTSAFGQYLERYTFANFDPLVGPGDAGSRHAVGHGAAPAESYTQLRALQAILTLDQFAFYL